MSRIGKKPIALPKGVTVKVNPDALDIQGPKGKLTQRMPPGIAFEVVDGQLKAAPMREDPELGKFHGLARSLAANGVLGVTEGFKRELDIVGVGYRAAVEGSKVVFALGFSHPIEFKVPEGIKIAVDKQTRVTVSGIDRQKVGQVAAEIRGLRRPDPYKQKGIRYVGEQLKKKAGKAGATGAK
jgi:large subunit ribosomal protein L6